MNSEVSVPSVCHPQLEVSADRGKLRTSLLMLCRNGRKNIPVFFFFEHKMQPCGDLVEDANGSLGEFTRVVAEGGPQS